MRLRATRLISAGRGRPAWTPAQIQTALWLDAADASTVTLNNLTVSQWSDKSGNARNAEQATAASQPVYVRGSNLLTYSEQLNQSAWTKIASTISANLIPAPDGTTTADKVQETATSDFHMVRQNFSFANNTQYTISGYFKAAERTLVQISALVGGVGSAEIFVNLSTGTLTTQTNVNWTVNATSIQSVGDGWYRASLTLTTTTGGAGFVDYRLSPGVPTIVYAGTAGSGVYMWGLQFQQGVLQPYQRTEATAITSGALNNLPVVAFDGSNDSLVGATANLARGVSSVSLIAVSRRPSNVGTGGPTVLIATPTNGTRAGIGYNQLGFAESYASGRRLNADGIQAAGTTTFTSSWQINVGWLNYSAADLRLIQNGTQVAQVNPFQTAGVTPNDGGTLYMGALGAAILNVEVGEILVLENDTANSVAVRQQLEGYLAWKWGGF